MVAAKDLCKEMGVRHAAEPSTFPAQGDVDGSKLGTENGWLADYHPMTPKFWMVPLKLCTIVWYPLKKRDGSPIFFFLQFGPFGG